MRTDSSLHALRDASPRNQPGFDEWIDSFDSLRTQIPATPVPAQRPLPKPDSRHRRVVGLAVTVAIAVAVVGVVVGLALTAASPPSADAAAQRALAATAAAPSGTMATTLLHGGVTHTLEVTRWNGSDIAFSPGGSDVPFSPGVSSIRQLLLIGGGVYVQTSDGTWLHYANASDVPPKPLGGMVQYARDNLAGTTAQQILALATGVQKTAQSDGTTVYTGTIPNSIADARIAPSDDNGAITRMIFGVLKSKEGGALALGGGNHNGLQLQMSVGGDGLVRQVSLTFQQQDPGSPALDGTYTWSITYSQLGSTAPITAPARSTDAPPGTLPQNMQTQNTQTPQNKPLSK
jgi:hypothetical protein